MSLDILDTKIRSLRAQAEQLRVNYRNLSQGVWNDLNLSITGRKAALDSIPDPGPQLRALEAEEKRLIEEAAITLERRIGGTVGTGTTAVVSFRDARDRASRLKADEDAEHQMTEAIRGRDDELAKAYLFRAVNEGWLNTVNVYAAAFPTVEPLIQDLYDLRSRTRDDVKALMESAMAYSVPAIVTAASNGRIS